MTRACVSLPKRSFLQISSLNRLFLTIGNVTFPSGDEFPRDTTKVFQLSSNEPSNKHARVSTSSERDLQSITARSFLRNHLDAQQLISLP